MIPTPIPDDEIWEGARRVVIGPPLGHDPTGDIRAVEALIDQASLGQRFLMRLVPEPGELERMADGEPMWLAINATQLPPFNVTMAREGDE